MASLHRRIFRQLTVAHGSDSETDDIRTFAPDLDETDWPAFVVMKRTHYVTIKNLWAWWLKSSSYNLQTLILEGKCNGLFNPSDENDAQLFQWLWSRELDNFVQYWNCHRVRSQKKKKKPSGASPLDVYHCPGSYGYEDLSIAVDPAIVEHHRSQLPVSREEAFAFVDTELKAAADEAYAKLGKPKLVPQHGWDIFNRMQARLRHTLDDTMH